MIVVAGELFSRTSFIVANTIWTWSKIGNDVVTTVVSSLIVEPQIVDGLLWKEESYRGDL